MSELPVPGFSLQDRARRLAGSFAELAVQRLELRTSGGGTRPLAVRQTDLPGTLESLAAEDRLVCASLGVSIRRDGERLYWSASVPHAAAELAERLGN